MEQCSPTRQVDQKGVKNITTTRGTLWHQSFDVRVALDPRSDVDDCPMVHKRDSSQAIIPILLRKGPLRGVTIALVDIDSKLVNRRSINRSKYRFLTRF